MSTITVNVSQQVLVLKECNSFQISRLMHHQRDKNDAVFVSLYNGMSSLIGYLMPKLSFYKNSCGNI